MIVFRHGDPRYPFLWEKPEQPAARYHADNDGPAQYFADTADGAWAEFIRHAEITDPDELELVQRALWCVEIPDHKPAVAFGLSHAVATGDKTSYAACRDYARSLRNVGEKRLHAPSAALVPGGAKGWKVDNGLKPGAPKEGIVVVIFDYLPNVIGWKVCVGSPPVEVLSITKHF